MPLSERFWTVRVVIGLVLALAPATVAAIVWEPSPAMFAAFGSGVLFSVWALLVRDREEARSNATR